MGAGFVKGGFNAFSAISWALNNYKSKNNQAFSRKCFFAIFSFVMQRNKE